MISTLLNTLRTWVSPPHIQRNEEQMLQIRLLQISLICIGVYLFLVLLSYFLGVAMPAGIVIADGILFLLLFLFWRWFSQGRILASALGLLVASFITSTLVILSVGTVNFPATMTYGVIVLIAGVFFQRRGVWISTTAASLAVLLLLLVQNPVQSGQELLAIAPDWFTYSLIFLISGSLIHVAMQTMRTALAVKDRENEERRLAEEKFSKAFLSSPDSIIISSLDDGRYLEVNDSFLLDTGFAREEIIGFTSLERSIWATPADRERLVHALASQGRVRSLEAQYHRKSGEVRDAQISAEVIELENGKKHLLAVVRDITESRQAARLQETVYRIAQAAQAANNLSDLYPKIHRQIAGVMPAENFYIVLYDKATDLMHFVYAVDEQDASLMTGQQPAGLGLTSHVLHTGRSLLIREDQYTAGVQPVGTPTRIWLGVPLILQGKTIGAIAVHHYTNPDAFTEREQHILEYVSSQIATAIDRTRSMELLRQGQASLEAAQAIAHLGSWELDPLSGKCLFWSKEMFRLFQRDPASAAPDMDEFLELVHPADRQLLANSLQLAVDTREPIIMEYRASPLAGEEHYFKVTVQAVHDAQGRLLHVSGTVLENTETRRAQQELRHSRDALSATNAALEKAARLKDEFMASMSHELRTPLTGILGLSEALQMEIYEPLNPRQLKALKNIESSGRHLLELINDVLDLSKIEADRLELQLQQCPVAEICRASLQLVKGMARQKQQEVQFTADPPDAVLNADPRRFKQMLVNLLSNAIKFTPAGGDLGLEVSGSPDESEIYLAVWDKGIGIKPEYLERLFKPFTQLDNSLSRETPGTGLGLSLVAKLAELHGGSIKVDSVLGEGSRFTLTLPWKSAPGASGNGRPSPAG
jgi:PAS domain S-box-containing protein